MTWYLAPSLTALRSQVNARWPHRSKVSDGTIGNAEHAARPSDHNPKPDGEGGSVVDAMDLTHDPAVGADMHAWARQTAARPDERVKYLISNRAIWNPSTTAWATYRRLRAEGHSRTAAARMALPGWRAYTGDNPHTRHVHVSVRPSGRVDTSSWFDPPAAPPGGTWGPITEDDAVQAYRDTAPELDGSGNGWFDLPIPQPRIVAVWANPNNPPDEGGYVRLPEMAARDIGGGRSRIVVTGGQPKVAFGYTVWVTTG